MARPTTGRAADARELWRRLESLHAVTYFAPETLAAAQELGLRGFWRAYFGFRAAPLGACTAGVVTAAFFGFSPSMVARAIPSVWQLATAEALLEARWASAAAALRRIVGEEITALVDDGWTTDVLRDAVERGIEGSLPLYLANRALDHPDDPVAAVWQLATTLREHRGDGHVAAWTARGVAPVEVAVLFVAVGGTTRAALQPSRGWSDEEWEQAGDRLAGRGLLAAGRVTSPGRELVAAVESTTDTLAAAPFSSLRDADRRRLLDALDPVARAVTRSGTIPTVNPMGVRLVGDG